MWLLQQNSTCEYASKQSLLSFQPWLTNSFSWTGLGSVTNVRFAYLPLLVKINMKSLNWPIAESQLGLKTTLDSSGVMFWKWLGLSKPKTRERQTEITNPAHPRALAHAYPQKHACHWCHAGYSQWWHRYHYQRRWGWSRLAPQAQWKKKVQISPACVGVTVPGADVNVYFSSWVATEASSKLSPPIILSAKTGNIDGAELLTNSNVYKQNK